jgi:hypothetical protein
MNRTLFATAALAVVALAGACTTVSGSTPLPEASYSEGICPDSSGVTVIVDFAPLVDEILVRCALGPQATGYDALAAIGVEVNVNAPGAVPGTVCTLDGLPTEGYPYCWTEGGYWSSWFAPSTAGTWDYAPGGPGDPIAEGTAYGWAWAPDFLSDGPRVGPDGALLP